MADDLTIVCNRVVFVDSEFDAKKGQGMPPGPPVCICAIEVDQHGHEIEHRLAAPYPRAAALGSRRSVPHDWICTVG